MKHRWLIFTSILIVALAAACSPAAPAAEIPTESVRATSPPVEAAPAEDLAPSPEIVEPTQADAIAENPTAEPTDEPVVANEPPKVTCEVSQALHATDPSGVQLASGQVQLVEFFAFW